MENLSNVTRLEIIDNTICDACLGVGTIYISGQPGRFECPSCHGNGMGIGREVVFWNANKQVEASLQDDGRTLKIFVNKRGDVS